MKTIIGYDMIDAEIRQLTNEINHKYNSNIKPEFVSEYLDEKKISHFYVEDWVNMDKHIDDIHRSMISANIRQLANDINAKYSYNIKPVDVFHYLNSAKIEHNREENWKDMDKYIDDIYKSHLKCSLVMNHLKNYNDEHPISLNVLESYYYDVSSKGCGANNFTQEFIKITNANEFNSNYKDDRHCAYIMDIANKFSTKNINISSKKKFEEYYNLTDYQKVLFQELTRKVKKNDELLQSTKDFLKNYHKS